MNLSEEILPPLFPINIPYSICEAVIGTMAVLGNGIVITVFWREEKLRKTSNYFIISLAFADFLLGLIGIPFAILIEIGLPRNLHFCLLAISILVGLSTISIFCLIGVSIDRFWLILRPLENSHKVRKKRIMINIGCCWFLGFIVGFLPIFGWHINVVEGRCIFVEKVASSYFIFFCIVSVIIPTLILVGIYGLIYRVMHKLIDKSKKLRIQTIEVMNKYAENQEDPKEDEGIRELEKREVRATQNLALIVASFVIFWLPLNICNIINVAAVNPQIDPTVLLICIALSHANSAFNPFLYAYSIEDFRKSFLKLFCRKNLF